MHRLSVPSSHCTETLDPRRSLTASSISPSALEANKRPYCHLRRVPAWYQDGFTFFTPATSAAMAKRVAEERKGQWALSEGREETDSIGPSFIESCLCPCIVYSRSWARLRAVLAGEDARKDPNIGYLNPDCCQFVACFPVYGFSVSRLQNTVRSFYGINGTEATDWRDGWCCPCTTLQRNETEILIRDKQHRDFVQKSPYQSPDSMTYASRNTGPSTTSNQAPILSLLNRASMAHTSPSTGSSPTSNQAPILSLLNRASMVHTSPNTGSSPTSNHAPDLSYLNRALLGYNSPKTGKLWTKKQPKICHEELKGAMPGIKSDTAGYSTPRQIFDGNIPIIHITSPQVVIESRSPSLAAACLEDPQIASGHIIQPEYGIDDARTAVKRGKYKEHGIDHDSVVNTGPVLEAQEHRVEDDSVAKTGPVLEAKEHRVEDDASQRKPEPTPSHDIIECRDGTISPPPGTSLCRTEQGGK